MVWHKQDFFIEAQKAYGFLKGIPEIRLFFLQSCIRSVHNIEGCFVECGTRNGKSALFTIIADDRKRNVYLFDSFEGLSDPVAGKDTTTARDPKTGFRLFGETNYSNVLERFSKFNVQIFKGWIPERFADAKEEAVAFLHIDVDMYEPTLQTLEYFYPRVAKNGIIVCDDYGSDNYPGARKAFDEFFEGKVEKPIELPQGQCLVMKR